jgi:hypothetical protein
MASQEDFLYAIELRNIKTCIKTCYSYSILSASIWNCLAFAALFFSNETGCSLQCREKKLTIFIFKVQYAITLIFTINMVLNENLFSYPLFNYVLTKNVPDWVCKLHFVIKRYVYCMAPFFQMVCSVHIC